MAGRQLYHARKQRAWMDAKQERIKAAKILRQAESQSQTVAISDAQEHLKNAQKREAQARREMFDDSKKKNE